VLARSAYRNVSDRHGQWGKMAGWPGWSIVGFWE
jgi:hypothetical protein